MTDALSDVIRAAVKDRVFQHANGNLIGLDLAIADIAHALVGWKLVPLTPTDEMLQPACDGHKPGLPMKDGYDECPHFQARRRIWSSMTAQAPAYAQAKQP